MRKRIKLVKKVSIAFCMMIAMCMMVQMPVMAKSNKNYLPKSMKVTTNSGDRSWTQTTKFQYNKKKNLTKVVNFTNGQKVSTTTYKYKYKKGKPTKMTLTHLVENDFKYTETYSYKKGHITSVKSNDSNSNSKYTYTKYGDIKKKTYTSNTENDNYSYTYKYNYKYYKSGLPKAMKMYLNNAWSATYKYNKKGLVTKHKIYTGTTDKYKYKYNKNGTVKSIVCTSYDKANKKTSTRTFTFSYTKKQISKNRYASIINGEGTFSPANF